MQNIMITTVLLTTKSSLNIE